MESKVCEFCGEMFYRTSKYTIKQHWNKVRFCDNKCAAQPRRTAYKRPLRFKKCEQCLKDFSKNLRFSVQQWEKAKYCSPQCHWTGMVKLVKASLEKDGFKCTWCNSSERLEADHIEPWSLFPEKRLDLDNGRTLCHDCHKKTDTYGGRINKISGVVR